MEKIAFIDHSYHQKTKSSEFFINFLKKKYIVEVIWDVSWCSGETLDVSQIDENYYAVIFWQNIYPEAVNTIRDKCTNIIFIPMYDASILAPLQFWQDIVNVKIVNFSRTLHAKTCKMGFQSFYIQYFPDYKFDIKPQDVIKQENSLFFWNRREEFNWKIIKNLIGSQKINKVHIHKAMDPEHKFLVPSKVDEERFNITYSSWFTTRNEYIAEMNKYNIYIAPRLTEGIGFSFLEAMAMGKAVIAIDAPTMNEYIKHGENGYLFSLEDPVEIDFNDVMNVQNNARRTIQNGIEKWHEDKEKIFNFIAAPIIIRIIREKTVIETIVNWKKLNLKYSVKRFMKRNLPNKAIEMLKKVRWFLTNF